MLLAHENTNNPNSRRKTSVFLEGFAQAPKITVFFNGLPNFGRPFFTGIEMNLETPLTIRSMIEPVIKRNGGWVNTHAHADRSFTLSPDVLQHEKDLYAAAEMGCTG